MSAYKDAGLTSAHPFPILSNGFGRVPTIWIGVGNYKLVLKDASGALLDTIDDLPGGVEVVPPAPSAASFNTGDVKGSHTDDLQDGWLPLNGLTIGNPNSPANGRANLDVQALFEKLWNKDASLAVLNGRGASASADWAAGKTIALPDYRGKTLFGVDQMGGTATAGILTAATTPTPNTIGAMIGGETETLLAAHLPAISPAITIGAAGGHSHTGATDAQGAHAHGGATSTAGAHQHNVNAAPNIINGTSGNSYGSVNGTYVVSTDAQGNHVHSIATDTQGLHAHNVSTNAVPDHTHAATIAALGQGQAHSKIPPGILGYWHIKI